MLSLKLEMLLNQYDLTDEEIESFNTLDSYECELNSTFLEDAESLARAITNSTLIEYEDRLDYDFALEVVLDMLEHRFSSLIFNQREHIELLVSNFVRAYEYMEHRLTYDDFAFSAYLIKLMHKLIMMDLDVNERWIAGDFRDEEYSIKTEFGVSEFTHPDNIAKEVIVLCKDINKFLGSVSKLKPMEKLDKILDLKRRFIKIHPFMDGNGRCSRLLMNTLLLKACLPLSTFEGWDRKDYHTGMLIAFQTNKDMSIIKKMYIQEVLREMDKEKQEAK